MNWAQLIELGKRAAEIGIERLLTAASIAEDVGRGAIERYNRFAEHTPVPLPKVPFGPDGRETGTHKWSETATGHGSTSKGPSVVSAVDLAEKASTVKQRAAADTAAQPAAKTDTSPAPSKAEGTPGQGKVTASSSATQPPSGELTPLPSKWLLDKTRRDVLQAYCKERGLAFEESDIKAVLVAKLMVWTKENKK